MNQTAVEDLFLRDKEITNATVGEATTIAAVVSDAKDWRKWGADRTKDLVVSLWLTGPTSGGKVKRFTAGACTAKLMTQSEGDGETWTEIYSKTGVGYAPDACGRILTIPLAGLPLKQFVKLSVQVTTQYAISGTATAPKLTAGLDNDANFDIDATLVDTHATNPAAR